MKAKNEHSIDRIFRQGLKEYKDKAPEHSWSVISAELQYRKKVRYLRITKYAAAIVALLVAFYFGYEFSENNFSDNATIVQKTENSTPGSSENQTTFSEEPVSRLELIDVKELTADATNVAIITRKAPTDLFAVQSAERRSSLTSLESFDFGLIKNQAYTEISFPENYGKNLLKYSGSGMLVLNEKNDHPKASKQESGRWVLGGVYTPTYAYRTTNNDNLGIFNNTYQSDHNEPDSYEEALITYSGGINAQYTLNENWQLETGLYYSRFGQKKNAASVKNEELNEGGKNYYLNTSAGKVDGNKVPEAISKEIRGQYSASDASKEEYFISTSIDFELYQNFDYLEIPLIAKYKVYDRKFGINLVSGLNTGLLVNNETHISTEKNKLDLGQTENLRSFLNSAIAGVDFQIPLTKQFILNFEPTFKYALHSVNTSNEFGYRPYSFGVYSGVKFRF
ncbi:MAG: outer membrane beta-barrel protein [Bacteroidales bacterium]|nr:outer membrane beta-barrel protein [Bacteroidales bacterium]MCF8336899.1 outer membrane beta-barrel protein [Bacteroidales bacterium]